MISFTCDFLLVSKARPRFSKGRTFTPAKTKAFETAVRFAARSAMANQPPMTTPCRLEIYALFAPPASWPKWKKAAAMGKPYTCASDADNMLKAVADGMNEIVYIDDRLVSHGSIERYYGATNQFRVTILPLEGVPATRAEAA
ncbi:MAG: RusA family crossover junction endodeoxyribonuclease [Rhodobacteraceae bacterium]|nr:RusA family crossover junction endodeoxyribonuclease [Paracoccaceae bacterium]